MGLSNNIYGIHITEQSGIGKLYDFSVSVGLQCLSNAYGLDMTDPSQIAKYQVQRNLLDIFNAQLSLEVSLL